MPFKPGESGNPHGRKIEKVWRDAVLKAVRNRDGKGAAQELDLIAKALVTSAKAGDVSAIKEIGDRLDGKAVQALANEDGGLLQISIIRFTGEGT